MIKFFKVSAVGLLLGVVLFFWSVETEVNGAAQVLWAWSGGITRDSAVVKVRVAAAVEEVRLRLAREEGGERVWTEPTQPAAPVSPGGIAAFRLHTLREDTSYIYQVEMEEEVMLEGRFRTFPQDRPYSFRVAFASCATTGSDHRVFDTIRNLQPLFFLHMGDFHYEDIDENDPWLFRDAFDEVFESAAQSTLFRNIPVAYVWDDHDYGPDDSDRTAPGREAALDVYDEYVPHYPLQRPDGRLETIQQAFTVGRIRFILTDLRAAKDPVGEPDGPEKTMLGMEQRRWFFRELESAASSQALVVWMSTVPWITRGLLGSEIGWEPFDFERRLIAEKIAELGLMRRLVMLSGDAHMVAIDDGSNSNYAGTNEPGFPVMHAAPLDRYPRIKGGPFSHGTRPAWVLINWPRIKQFGLMEVLDDGEKLRIVLTGHRSDGDLLNDMTLHYECRGGACEIAPIG